MSKLVMSKWNIQWLASSDISRPVKENQNYNRPGVPDILAFKLPRKRGLGTQDLFDFEAVPTEDSTIIRVSVRRSGCGCSICMKKTEFPNYECCCEEDPLRETVDISDKPPVQNDEEDNDIVPEDVILE